MDTGRLKRFASEARTLLKEGVAMMLAQYGFDADGNLTAEQPQRISGGTLFLDKIFDEAFYDKWHSLYRSIQAHGVKEIYEEVAYTWFNRFMAIRIMRKNGFIRPVLEYPSADVPVPQIVMDARRGNIPVMSAADRRRLDDLLLDDSKTFEQFAILIVAFCESNPVLNACFGKINDYTEFLLPKSILAKDNFVDMINNTPFITDEDYKQSELIGWLYQFFISEKKDEVFASFSAGKKAEAEDIPAATQIFTPNWIVKYMTQNTLGRIYLDNNPGSPLADNWKYLVPEAKGSENAPKLKIDQLEELTLIDPGCGSGHILSEGFDMLYDMYLAEFAQPREACESILTCNLVGIDLDTRAKQLAQFSILMKACQKDDSFLDAKVLPRIYDMPEPYDESEVPLRDTLPHFFLGGDKKTIEETIDAIKLMDQAKNLGSIMKFKLSDNTRFQIKRRLEEIRRDGQCNSTFANLALYFDVILALTDKYACVVANPPYMSNGNMNSALSKYVKNKYPSGKADMFSVFMLIGMDLLTVDGKMGMINMQSWMFLTSFEILRKQFIDNYHIDNMLHLGPHTFDELGGEVVQNTAFVVSNNHYEVDGQYFRLVEFAPSALKSDNFRNIINAIPCYDDLMTANVNLSPYYFHLPQEDFDKIPGRPIGYWISNNVLHSFDYPKIGEFTLSDGQILTGNNEKYLRLFWETDSRKTGIHSGKKWTLMAKGGGFRKWYGNIVDTVNWSPEARSFYRSDRTARILAEKYWYREAVTWGVISTIRPSFRLLPEGYLFNKGGYSVFFNDSEDKEYIIGVLNTKYAEYILNLINPTLSTTINDVQSIPLNVSRQQYDGIKGLVVENISISKNDWDAHETSWDFQENEIIRLLNRGLGTVSASWGENPPTVVHSSLQMLVEEYKAKWKTLFETLHANEEELNRRFIEIYGLQDELTPDVPLNEVTILQQGEISFYGNQLGWHDDVIVKQLISYLIGCYMGRYRLDRPGLAIAYPDASADEIAPYTIPSCGAQFRIDEDGIIPLLPADCGFNDNANMLVRNAILNLMGNDAYADNLNFVDKSLGKPLEEYLFKDFWVDHKRMYQNHPIYWLFSSKNGAFKVIAYAHRMTRHTVGIICRRYLLPYIENLRGRASELQSLGSATTSAQRRALQTLLKNIEECKEYYVRLHAVENQQIEFDLDDGVIKNYALFGDVLAKIK